ncbi:MAG: response regulator [Betaproteobacteria bacterium]|nr:MAG: response regulator [Betaproteobacteria bacterium]
MAKRVLIVDDDPNILISLEFLLAKAGYEVHTAADGKAALEAVQRIRPDLLLLDVMLPVKNGFEVCQTLRGASESDAMKVVMLTAKGRSTEVAKGLALGADAYVTKPFGTRDLVETVRRLLGE